jgi:drug/metabolite transporter (DMT)-like permease
MAGSNRLTRARAHLALASVVVVWAGAFAAIKHLLEAGLTGPEIAAGRYLVAAPGFAAALRWKGAGGLGRRELPRIALAGVLVVSVYHLALNAGERHTTAGTAAVIIGTAPGITLGLALLIGLERFSAWRAVGLGVAFVGVVIVVTLGAGHGFSLDNARGPLLVIISAMSFALYNVLVKPLTGRVASLSLTSVASLAGTVPLLLLMRSSSLDHAGELSMWDWTLVAYLGLVCTLSAYVLWTSALGHLDASRAVAYLYGVPAMAVVIGAITLGEPVTIWLALGGALIIGGVIVAQVRR